MINDLIFSPYISQTMKETVFVYSVISIVLFKALPTFPWTMNKKLQHCCKHHSLNELCPFFAFSHIKIALPITFLVLVFHSMFWVHYDTNLAISNLVCNSNKLASIFVHIYQKHRSDSWYIWTNNPIFEHLSFYV